MTPETARKRYLGIMMGSSFGYLGAVFGVSFLHDKLTDGSLVAIFLAAIPALFIVTMTWGIWRFIKETDEVGRHYLTQAMMSSLIILLAFSGGWGLIELFNDSLTRLPIFFVFPGFFLIFGLISAVNYKRCV